MTTSHPPYASCLALLHPFVLAGSAAGSCTCGTADAWIQGPAGTKPNSGRTLRRPCLLSGRDSGFCAVIAHAMSDQLAMPSLIERLGVSLSVNESLVRVTCIAVSELPESGACRVA